MARRKIASRKVSTRKPKLKYSREYARQKRDRATSRSYIDQAKQLAPLVPELKKLSKLSRLTPAQKSRVTHYAKILKNVPDLRPVSNADAKKLKKALFAPGVQAIPLKGVPPNASIHIDKRGDMTVTYGRRTWVYWHLDRSTIASKSKFSKAANRAFEGQFPIEILSELAAKAFAQTNIEQIHLWGANGRVGEGFQDLPAFVRFLNEKYQAGRYVSTINGYENKSDPTKWINGLAILLTYKLQPSKGGGNLVSEMG